jgi:hypothetical protein
MIKTVNKKRAILASVIVAVIAGFVAHITFMSTMGYHLALESAVVGNVRGINTALRLYKADNSTLPTSLKDIVSAGYFDVGGMNEGEYFRQDDYTLEFIKDASNGLERIRYAAAVNKDTGDFCSLIWDPDNAYWWPGDGYVVDSTNIRQRERRQSLSIVYAVISVAGVISAIVFSIIKIKKKS